MPNLKFVAIPRSWDNRGYSKNLGSPNTSPWKILEKGRVGVSMDGPNLNFWVPPIIPGTCKAMNFKFGRYIHRVHPNKRPLKFGRKGSVGVSRDCRIFFQYPLLSQERVKLRTSVFLPVRTFLVGLSIRSEQKPITNSGLSKFFRAPTYWVHRAVVFAIAQLSCFLLLWMIKAWAQLLHCFAFFNIYIFIVLSM